MASIYHIENDVACRVLHFGKELCIAMTGDDCVINLLKGRHKLTFESLENSNDAYSMVFEVPEDGIEDFIDVCLLPIRNKRIEEENRIEEARRRMLEEQRRIEEENRLRLLAEEQQRLEEEIEAQKRKLKEEEERAEEERLEALKEKEHQENLRKIEIQKENLHDKIVSSFKKVRSFIDEMADIDGYLYNECRWVQKKTEQSEDENIEDTHEIVYNLYRGENQIHDWDFTEVNRFSDGLALVKHDEKYYYIDIQGDIKLGPYEYATNFQDGISYVCCQNQIGSSVYRMDKLGLRSKVYDGCLFVFKPATFFPYIFITSSVSSTNVCSLNIYSWGELIHTLNLFNYHCHSSIILLGYNANYDGLSFQYNKHNMYTINLLKHVSIDILTNFIISEKLNLFCVEFEVPYHQYTLVINSFGEVVVCLKDIIINSGAIDTDINAIILYDEQNDVYCLYDQYGKELGRVNTHLNISNGVANVAHLLYK